MFSTYLLQFFFGFLFPGLLRFVGGISVIFQTGDTLGGVFIVALIGAAIGCGAGFVKGIMLLMFRRFSLSFSKFFELGMISIPFFRFSPIFGFFLVYPLC